MRRWLDAPTRWLTYALALGAIAYLLVRQDKLNELSEGFTRDIRAILDLAEQPKPDEGQEGQEGQG